MCVDLLLQRFEKLPNMATTNDDKIPASGPPRGIMLITHARSASNMLMKAQFSGQDSSIVKAMEYNFGLNVIAVQERLIANGMDDIDESGQKAICDVYATGAKKMLDAFSKMFREVCLFVLWLSIHLETYSRHWSPDSVLGLCWSMTACEEQRQRGFPTVLMAAPDFVCGLSCGALGTQRRCGCPG
jgi:hypothetical protein